ncbi:MAG: caspase family protein [Byssovorax sp.]
MTQTKAYAVLIGVDDYSTYDASNKHNLLGCVNDVRAFWDVCVTSGFAPENIHVLTNPPLDPAELGGLARNFKPATRANILAEQEALVGILGEDARAVGILVYSGHGAWIDDASADSAVICPSDFWMDRSYPNNEIPVQKLWQGAGSNLTVVLDCCHSGGRDRHASHPITPRDPHRKHLPTARAHAQLEASDPTRGIVADDVGPTDVINVKQGSPDQVPPKEINKDAFTPLKIKDLALHGLLPIGTAVPLTLTARVLTEKDLQHSPYRKHDQIAGGARVLAACEINEAAYQAEFAGRFHGAFTWALTSTVGQWRVEEAPDGAIRTTIGCGAVKRHAASLLQVFTFKQTPVLHPMSAVNLPFFGVPGPISEKPTGDIFPLEIDPSIKNLKLTLTSSTTTGILSKIEIVRLFENWSLGADFMHELSVASAANHTAIAYLATTASLPAPTSPVTTFSMPSQVSWGSPVSAPSGAGFYSMSGSGPSVVAMFFHLDLTVSPMKVTGIDWYQGVAASLPDTYALVSPGRNFTFAATMPTPPGGLTWYHALVSPV